MANWGRSFAQGLESGFKIGEALKKRRQQEELAAAFAAPEDIQGYSDAQAEQLRAAAESGQYDVTYDDAQKGYVVTPKADATQVGLVAPTQTQQYAGQRVEGTFDPTQLRGLQMRKAAAVLGKYGDPMEAARLMAQADEQEFQSKYRPMQLQQAQQNIDEGGLRLGQLKRTEDVEGRVAQLDAWRKDNPNASTSDVFAKANEFGIPPERQFKLIEAATGISSKLLEANATKLKALVQGKGFTELLDMHKSSKDIDPTSHFEQRVDPKTKKIVLDRVDTATGKVIQANVVSGSEDELVGWLNKKAVAPETVAEYTANLAKQEREKRAADDESAYKRALTNASNSKLNEDKLGTKVNALRKQLGREPTEAEILSLAGVSKGDSVASTWASIEKDMYKNMSSPAEIARAKENFYASNGYAPASDLAIIRSGVDPDTGKPFTAQDYAEFNAMYPNSQVTPPAGLQRGGRPRGGQ